MGDLVVITVLIVLVIALFITIVQRRQVEGTLKASEERLRLALEGAADGIWDWNLKTGQVYFSPRYYTMLGYEPGDFPASYESWRQLLHPHDAPAAAAALQRAIEEQSLFAAEFRLRTRNGEWRWILGRGKVVETDKLRKAVRIAGSHTDITGRKQVEEELGRQTALFRNLFEGSPEAIAILDQEDRVLELNRSFETLFGYANAEAQGRNINDLVAPEPYLDDAQTVSRAVLQDGRIVEKEGVRCTRDGCPLDVSLVGYPIVVDGQQIGAYAIYRDISEYKRAQEALRREQEFTRELLENMVDGVVACDATGKPVLFNRTAREWHGLAPGLIRLEEIAARFDLYAEDSLTPFSLAALPLNRAFHGERLRDEPMVIRAKGQPPRYISANCAPFYDSAGELLGAVTVMRDLTAAKRAQQELEETKILLEATFAQTPVPMVLVSMPDTIIRIANSAAARFLLDEDEPVPLGRRLSDYKQSWQDFDSEGRPLSPAELPLGLAMQGVTTRNRELRVRRQDGTWRWNLVSAAPVYNAAGEQIAAFLAFPDITERKQVEEALRKSEERFQLFVRHFPGLAYIKDSTTRTLFANQGFMTYLAIDPAEIIGKTNEEVFPPEFAQAITAADRRVLESGQSEEIEERYAGRIWSTCKFVLPQPGQPPLLGGFTLDITRQRQAEAALRESEFFLQKSQAVARIGSYCLDARTGQWISSPALDEIFGIDDSYSKDIEGWIGLVHPNYKADMRQYWTQYVLADHNRFEKEYPILQHDNGQERWVYGLGELEYDEGGQSITMIGTIQDITERKRAEAAEAKLTEQLRQAQKMESIGRLAGGIAHDFNNVLTAIKGYSHFLLTNCAGDDPAQWPPPAVIQADLKEILKAADRAAGLTRQLLAFSRKQLLQPRSLNLNELLRDLDKMLRRLIGEDIDLALMMAPDLGHVHADPGQLEQVVLNLAVNARDAMPQGGKLTFETANVTLDETYGQTHSQARPGPYVLLAVSDNGTGMDDEVKSHLFEPFFTTKARGEGTGLGLATAHGIISQSGGHIEVYSEVGLGSTFKVYLPLSVEETAASKSPTVEEIIPSGTETILVVEDEPPVRSLLERTLKLCGYTVLTAAGPEEALALSAAYPGPIHLLLTDVVMPGMNGKLLAEQVVAARPALKVVYMSGYTDNTVIHHGVLEAGLHFIQKPFMPTAVARKIRAVLNAGPDPA